MEGERRLKGYITSKAEQFMAWVDRGRHPHGMFMDFPEPEMKLAEQAIRQLMTGHGFDASNPIVGVGTTTMHMAVAIIGLQGDQIASTELPDGFLDKHVCYHPVTGAQINLFNRVPAEPDTDDTLARPEHPMRRFGKNNNLHYRIQAVLPTHIIELTIKMGCYECPTTGMYTTHHYADRTLAEIARYLIERMDADGDYLSGANGFSTFLYLLDAYSPHQSVGRCQCGSPGWERSSTGLENLSSAIFSGLSDDAAPEYFSMRIWPMTIYASGNPSFIPGDDVPDVAGIKVGMNSPTNLPFSMTICGLHELFRQLQRSRPTHVISIGDPGVEPFEWPPTISLLALNFYDVDSVNEARARNYQPHEIPYEDHAASILAFARSIPPFGRLLIHCWAGVSRSTACAAIIIASAMPGNEDMAIDVVKKIRPEAAPNRRLIEAGDKVLGCEGRLVRSL